MGERVFVFHGSLIKKLYQCFMAREESVIAKTSFGSNITLANDQSKSISPTNGTILVFSITICAWNLET